MLILHTALHAEARALINHYQLKRQHSVKAFACFAADDVFLIESGVGKIHTANAIGWVNAYLNIESPVHLNIGIAGHISHSVGSCYLAQRIEDAASGLRYYPPQLLSDGPACENLLTVDQPSQDYPHNCLLDMEASAHIQAANRFTSIELIQSIKIISDNKQHPIQRLKARDVEALLIPHMQTIANVVQQLLNCRHEIIDTTSSIKQQLLPRWHFSQYQQQELKRLIQRYAALYPEHNINNEIPSNIDNSKKMMRWLKDTLAAAPNNL